jgi:hypothetical protein
LRKCDPIMIGNILRMSVVHFCSGKLPQLYSGVDTIGREKGVTIGRDLTHTLACNQHFAAATEAKKLFRFSLPLPRFAGAGCTAENM